VIEIAKMVPECDFIMAGGGELEQTLASSIPSNLFMVGWQRKEEMWAIADLALCTSDSEGMPLSLIEAQMSGVPVVSTDVGSVSEIVEDGVTGKLAPKDSRKLADAVREVVENISKGSEMSRASKVRANRLFDLTVMVKAHEDLYRQLLR
jgi:glycosyltransferase involved in cell wall biosynthesis